MIMVRVVAPPGQTGRNGHPRARCEDWERYPLAPAATTGGTRASGANYSAGRGFTVSW